MKVTVDAALQHGTPIASGRWSKQICSRMLAAATVVLPEAVETAPECSEKNAPVHNLSRSNTCRKPHSLQSLQLPSLALAKSTTALQLNPRRPQRLSQRPSMSSRWAPRPSGDSAPEHGAFRAPALRGARGASTPASRPFAQAMAAMRRGGRVQNARASAPCGPDCRLGPVSC